MAEFVDMTGQRIGMLTIEKRLENNKHGGAMWACKCDCGNEVVASGINIRRGKYVSCGCYIGEVFKDFKEQNLFKGTYVPMIKKEKPQSNNKSGVTGVSLHKARGKWVAEITFQGKSRYLGGYLKKEDAIKARRQAEEELFHPTIEEYENLTKE